MGDKIANFSFPYIYDVIVAYLLHNSIERKHLSIVIVVMNCIYDDSQLYVF